MRTIVGGYVKLADRQALEGLERHHRLLLKELAGRSEAKTALSAPMVKVIEEELVIIEAGMQNLVAG